MDTMQDLIRQSFSVAEGTLAKFLAQPANLDSIAAIAEQLAACFRSGGKVLIFGNGGSMCDAMHFAEELTGKFRQDRPSLPVIAISDPAHITCVANDYGFDQIFSRGVEAFAKPGDTVIGISTSGNSLNVITALKTATRKGCSTIALLGRDGGTVAGTCDHELIVPGETADRIQEVHTTILHILIECVEALLFDNHSAAD